MDMTEPAKVPGATLAAERDAWGVNRTDLAKRLKVHRNTLSAWESDPALDVIRQRRYRRALSELVTEATALEVPA